MRKEKKQSSDPFGARLIETEKDDIMRENQPPFEQEIQSIEEMILRDYSHGRVIDRMEMFTQPDRLVIEALIEKLFRLVFPGYFRDRTYRVYNLKNNLSNLIEDIAFHLHRQIAIAVRDNLRTAPDPYARAWEKS